MDFQEALAVLQSRSSGTPVLAPEHGGGEPTTASTMQCSACDEAVQQPAADAEIPNELALLGVGGLLRVFLEQQEARVAVYRRFEDGFMLFLQVAEANGYEALVSSTTANFAAISASVNRVEAELKSRGAAGSTLAATLRGVQLLEKDKLQSTAQLQILRHGIKIDEINRESEDDAAALAATRTHALRSEEAAGLRARLTEVTEQISEALDEVRAELVDGDFEEPTELEEGGAEAQAEKMAVVS